jgi:hypothetical protein
MRKNVTNLDVTKLTDTKIYARSGIKQWFVKQI